jgi:hypothetical protein
VVPKGKFKVAMLIYYQSKGAKMPEHHTGSPSKATSNRQNGCFTGRNLQQLWKELRARHRGRKTYYSLAKATDYSGFSRSTLQRAAKEGSPLLDGQKIHTEPFPNGLGRKMDCYLQDDLDAMKEARKAAPTKPANKYDLLVADFLEKQRVGGWLFNFFLQEERIELPTESIIDKRGQFHDKRIVTRAIAHQFKAWRAARNALPAGKMTATDAATRLNLHPNSVNRRFEHSTAISSRNGVRREHALVDRQEVEAAHNLQQGPGYLPRNYKDPVTHEVAEYWPFELGFLKNPNVTFRYLHKYKKKKCPRLGGDIFRAEFLPCSDPRRRRKNLWCGHSDDIMRMKAVKQGEGYPVPPDRLYQSHWAPHALACYLTDLNPSELNTRRRSLLRSGQSTERIFKKVENFNRRAPKHKLVIVWHLDWLRTQARNREAFEERLKKYQKRHAGGRKRTKSTERVYKVIYELYVKKSWKSSRVVNEVNKRFGIVIREQHVSDIAKRYALRHNLSMERKEPP